MILLDANILLRALTRSDDPAIQRLSDIAGDLLRQMDRAEVEATTSDAVLAEVAFMLTAKSHYQLPVADAAGKLATIIRLRGFKRRDKRVLLRALELWTVQPSLGFVDALTAALAQRPGFELATFDADFNTLPGITRWYPAGG
jgi:predicted nucleic acid-binding protein